MTERELAVFGMSTEDIREEYMESLTARLSGLEMVVMSILSDCQEMLAFGNGQLGISGAPEIDSKVSENIRKQLNVAKFILSEMMQSKEVA